MKSRDIHHHCRAFLVKLLLLLLVFCSSCYKDKGNYQYQELDEIAIGLAESYHAELGDSLLIQPQLHASITQHPDPANYTFQWGVFVNGEEEVLSDEQNLAAEITVAPGSYTLRFLVEDKQSGIQWQRLTLLTVTSSIYEGYLVLNDVDGRSRLDMLSYMDGDFNQITDVLSSTDAAVQLEGRPIQVFCMDINRWDNLYGIYLLTDKGTKRIHSETFEITATSDISYQFLGELPSPFIPQRLDGNLAYGSSPMMWLYAHGNVYHYTSFGALSFSSLPVNVYPNQATPFRVSPHIISHWNVGVFFDEEEKRFVTNNSENSQQYISVPVFEIFGYPEGLDLIHMESTYAGIGHAVLKDSGSGGFFFLSFVVGGEVVYFDEIAAPDFHEAAHYAVSPEFGYLFYSIGGKVFQYDPYLKSSKLMLDNPERHITYLAFTKFPRREENTQYAERSQQLTVGSQTMGGPAGSHGRLSIYTVPPVNGQIILQHEWDGFGKIVSVCYRER